MAHELRDVVPGLWIWRVDYADWVPGEGWDRTLTSTCVETGGEVVLLDPLAPVDQGSGFWARLSARPPTLIVILKPDHVRDLDFFARVTRRGHSGLRSSTATMYRKPNWKLSSPEAAGRSGCLIRWTRAQRDAAVVAGTTDDRLRGCTDCARKASCACGRLPGTSSECCRRYVRCSSFPLSR